jgi:hypothetical protein
MAVIIFASVAISLVAVRYQTEIRSQESCKMLNQATSLFLLPHEYHYSTYLVFNNFEQIPTNYL